MELPVSLQKVIDEMIYAQDGCTAYIDKKTGKLYTISDEEADFASNQNHPDSIPDYVKEAIPQIKEILNSPDIIELPDKLDINEHAIMAAFANSVDHPEKKQRLISISKKLDPEKEFKRFTQDFDLFDGWNEFHHKAVSKVAIDFLNANGIEFVEK